MDLLQSPAPTPLPELRAAVLLGNAALALECMRKIRLFELKSADLRIYFFFSCATLT